MLLDVLVSLLTSWLVPSLVKVLWVWAVQGAAVAGRLLGEGVEAPSVA